MQLAEHTGIEPAFSDRQSEAFPDGKCSMLNLELGVGIEPTPLASQASVHAPAIRAQHKSWSGRRGSNPRWEGGSLLPYLLATPASNLVRERGLEPPRPFGHQHLSLAWLPLHHSRIFGFRGGTRLASIPALTGSFALPLALCLGYPEFLVRNPGLEPGALRSERSECAISLIAHCLWSAGWDLNPQNLNFESSTVTGYVTSR